jgi:hypothetical protein
MKTVWLVIGSWDYEGSDEPEGVYSSKRLAERAMKRGYQGYDDKAIVPYKLDKMPPDP